MSLSELSYSFLATAHVGSRKVLSYGYSLAFGEPMNNGSQHSSAVDTEEVHGLD